MRARSPAVLLLTAAVVGSLLAGCTSDDGAEGPGSTAADGTTTTTLDPDAPCAALGGLGPRPVEPLPPASTPEGDEDAGADPGEGDPIDVLLFTRTEGFRHESIADAVAWFEAQDDLRVTATEETDEFTPEALRAFDVVAFVNTTGDVLDPAEQSALEAHVRQGGGFVGVHAAADTEADWPWYGELVGALFSSHPPLAQTVTVTTEHAHDPTVAHLDETWEHTDEIYNYDRNPRRTAEVLLSIDEPSAVGYDGQPVGDGFTMEGDHPIAWSQQVDDGRSWYTGLGHAPGTWDDPDFQQHVLEGVRWAAAPGRYEFKVVTEAPEAPSALEVAPSGLVLWTERTGELMRWDPASGSVEQAGTVPTEVIGEGGFIGVRLAADAATSGHLFTYATAPGGATNVLARYELDADCDLDADSREELLSVPNDGDGHQGGDIELLPDGTLLLSTGDNTRNADDEYAPVDPRPGQEQTNALRTSADPDDLRGKVLRVAPDGTIPDGNLFPDGEGGRPEIFAMGVRNAYRLAVHPDTGRLWFGDIGPDAVEPGPRGPQGFDELNSTIEPADFGWPRCIADRLPYRELDPVTAQPGAPFECAGTEAPVLAYDYRGLQVPVLGSSVVPRRFGTDGVQVFGRALMAGPFYRPGAEAPLALPVGDEALLLHEFGRNLLVAGTPQDDGSLTGLRRIAPWFPYNTPVDVEVAPDGSVYLLEVGQWSEISGGRPQLVRLAYSPTGTFPRLPDRRIAEEDDPAAREVDGADLYQVQCAGCHGPQGRGGTGPDLTGVADRLTLAEVLDVVRNGRAAMPAWSDVLTPEQIDAVVAFVRTLEADG